MVDNVTGPALPTLICIGAMKCGTSALHRYLDFHPEVAMSNPKELCFFFDPPRRGAEPSATNRVDGWTPGNWHRGVSWYAAHFRAEARARGESSPGYTSPSNPYVAERMAGMIPSARLIYLVRDPVRRALSQYMHHRREATEHRAPENALLDPNSHYISRSRYFERLEPFLRHFAKEQIAIVAQEELVLDLRSALSCLFAFVEVDSSFWSDELNTSRYRSNGECVHLDAKHRRRLSALLRRDADAIRDLAGRAFPNWSV
jgi:hypothetical protein